MKTNIKIDLTSDFFSLSRIACLNTDCVHNGVGNRENQICCILKNIILDDQGKCKHSMKRKEV